VKLFRKYLFPFILFFIMLSNAYSEDTILTFRLVHPDQDRLSQRSPEVKIDKNQYELFVKDNENFWIDKKVELDIKDIKSIVIKIWTRSASGREEYLPITLEQIDRTPELRSPSMNAFTASLFFTKQGAKKIQNVTEKNINRRLAVILNKRLLIAPRILDKISGDEIAIAGLSYEDIKSLTGAINHSASRAMMTRHGMECNDLSFHADSFAPCELIV